jgi:antitoxin component of MazEF toxin-antitoxin module
MPKTTTTTVQQDADGYYSVRIPKALGDALGLAGAQVEWEVDSGKSLTVTKADD